MRRRIAWFAVVAVALAAFLGGPSAVCAQQSVKLGAGDTLTISGFINATLFNNRGLFDGGQGQNAEWAALAQPSIDQGFVDGDIRNTRIDRKSTRLNSSHRTISYAVFCLKKKKKH